MLDRLVLDFSLTTVLVGISASTLMAQSRPFLDHREHKAIESGKQFITQMNQARPVPRASGEEVYPPGQVMGCRALIFACAEVCGQIESANGVTINAYPNCNPDF